MNLTPGDVRSLIIECLRRDRPYQPGSTPLRVEHLFHEIAELAKTRGLKVNSSVNAWLPNRDRVEIHPNLRAPIWSVVWDLIIEGILRPGAANDEPFELPYFHVTEYGKTAINGTITPYDPDGYLKTISAKVPNADPIILKYIAESAETLRRNCLLSSTITLGCASEKAFLLLLSAYEDALNSVDKPAFTTAIQNLRSIKLQHIEFKKWYDTKLRSRLKASKNDNDWMTEFENALTFLFSYFRDIRNDAGHPTGVTFRRELAQSHLVVFPAYLRLIYDLIEWLDANKPV